MLKAEKELHVSVALAEFQFFYSSPLSAARRDAAALP